MYGKAVAGKTVTLGQEREWSNHRDGCLDTGSLGQLAPDGYHWECRDLFSSCLSIISEEMITSDPHCTAHTQSQFR